jgi:hypothetical protein
MSSEKNRGAKAQVYPTSGEWEDNKEIMQELYIDLDLSLEAVQKEMARRGHVVQTHFC